MTVAQATLDMKKEDIKHYPVMFREVLELLPVDKKKFIVDCTAGVGSHSLKFLEVMKQGAFLIGIDKDRESLDIASCNLKDFEGRFVLKQGNFSQIDTILKSSHEGLSFIEAGGVDVFFFDLGISNYQLSNTERGFSFLKQGPLDMRMDRGYFFNAYDLVNNLSEVELANIFKEFGQERYARRIANFIARSRKKEIISTTTQLAQVILRAVPFSARKYRIHPATRVFQALRIAVNRELEVLEQGIKRAIFLLNKGGRIGVISFHSLEDRIVKQTFRSFSSQGLLKIITKKPLVPTAQEIGENSASRSAKFRVAEKINETSPVYRG